MRIELFPDDDVMRMRDDVLVMEYIRGPMNTYLRIDFHRFICAVLIFFANNRHQKVRAELRCAVVVLSVKVIDNPLGAPTIPITSSTLTCVISESSIDVNGTDSRGRKTGFITSQRSEFVSPRYRGLEEIVHSLIQ